MKKEKYLHSFRELRVYSLNKLFSNRSSIPFMVYGRGFKVLTNVGAIGITRECFREICVWCSDSHKIYYELSLTEYYCVILRKSYYEEITK